MKIHEYQAKDILRGHGVPVPRGAPAFSISEAERVAKQVMAETGGDTVVIKAQIHAGGRGKGGGIKLVHGIEAVHETAKRMLGMVLVTPQTGPGGRVVKRLLVEQGVAIAKELYVGMLIDRASGRVLAMASAEGGMDIEEVAARHPEKILKQTVDPVLGLSPYQARNLAYGIGLRGEGAKHAAAFLVKLYRAFVDSDASLAEINPLVVTGSGQVLALDCKMNFDDNAIFRQRAIEEMRDLDEEDPAEIEAKKYDLSYIKLDGNIGCMVNGAGLAMSTMDIIKHFGGRPANFLDVGGGASTDKVTAAFKIITDDPAVEGIFVNIFGGIMKCDTIADGVVAAVREVGLQVPLCVRLEGTNVELGRRRLEESGLPLTSATDMADGAQQIVALASGRQP